MIKMIIVITLLSLIVFIFWNTFKLWKERSKSVCCDDDTDCCKNEPKE